MERIGPYEILEELGQGGMGVVYRARQASLNRMIALKVLPSELESDETAVRRFRQEGETAARLKHDNIVSVYDAHVDEPPYYIAMEFLEGRSLESILAERGRLEPEEAVQIIAQVCAGLDHAHERGIVHRDIKPANIMVDESGKATITDFGIARATDQTRLTATGAVFGSPDYMSPEQAKGLPIDHRTDLYSVGAVLYEMLTGRSPFAGGSALTVMNRITTEPPPSASGFYPSISLALDAVVLKALDKDPRGRFQTGAEMVRALQGALQEPERVGAPPPESEQSPKPPVVSARRPVPLLAGGLMAVLVLIGAVLWAMRRPDIVDPPLRVPNLVGMSASEAEAQLSRLELAYEEAGTEFNDDIHENHVVRQDPLAGTSLAAVQGVSVWLSKGPPGVGDGPRMPDLRDKSVRSVKQELDELGLRYHQAGKEFSTYPHGCVCRHEPGYGEPYSPEQRVQVYLSLGQGVVVPDLSGETEERAKQALERAGLEARVKPTRSSSVEAGRVIRTEPASGTRVADHTRITLRVSSGSAPPPPPPIVSIPNVVGMTEPQAAQELDRKRLGCRVSPNRLWSGVTKDHVVKTDPRSGRVPVGTVVTLYLSRGPQPKCPHCNQTFDSQPRLNAHLAQKKYACMRYPDRCPFIADTREAVIRHYENYPEPTTADLLFPDNCRDEATKIGRGYRIKVIPAPACKNINNQDTWKPDTF